MRPRERAPWLLAALGFGLVAWGLRGPSHADVVAPRCGAVALVDGALVCDDALDVTDACGRRHVLRSGDALDAAGCGEPSRMSPDDLAALGVAIDPNRDSAADLASLPGIGPVLAERIVRGRPYADLDALLEVKGIGPRTLARIRPRLTTDDATVSARPSAPQSPRPSSAKPR